MPNKNSGTNLIICRLKSLLHGVIGITTCQRASTCYLLILFSYPPFSQPLLHHTETSGNIKDLNETSHVYLLVDGGLLIEILMTFTDDFGLSGSQPQ